MLRPGLIAVALMCALSGVAGPASAEVPPIPVTVQPTPKQSKFDKLANRTGVLQKRTTVPVQSSGVEGLPATVVRLEDLSAREVAMALQIALPEGRGVVVISEEEMADLKDSVQYILQNMAALNDSPEYVRVEYRALSGASLGYMVHHSTDTGGEWPPTAYVFLPASPGEPASGGLERITIQGLQRIVAEAQETMASLRPPKQP